jgi:hypothetical protein
MLTIGSIDRDSAARKFPFLAPDVRARRKAIREFTHTAPEYVFWIYPDGRLYDARDSHRRNPPKGFQHIIDDEPHYGGFLRGRVARWAGQQLIVVYCVSEALAESGPQAEQFLQGLSRMPVPIEDGTLVISDNGDIFGTVRDIKQRT